MRAEQEMSQLMCGNDTQDRCRTGPAAMVQLGDSIIEDVTVGPRANLIHSGSRSLRVAGGLMHSRRPLCSAVFALLIITVALLI